jgi:alanyl-tRNA synthetase
MNIPITTAEIRHSFLSYFKSHEHTLVESSSLIPENDATLLFTNAGMVQFKDTFIGDESRAYQTACSAQRCVRAGGKHNDLENVGYTARHHTFFEMLGNFSFGAYFKHEAIKFAWQYLTQVLKLPAEKLWVTVHVDDDEAEKIWLNDINIDPSRFSKLDEDNFWQMGSVGPCGPSSEIFYDHGPDIAGDPPGGPNDDGDRYIEIWNLVFMQFERHKDGSLTPLPNPSIDTGMGLERIAAVMQGVHNNYDIDIFKSLLTSIKTLLGVDDTQTQSLRVIADHIRSCSFLIADGVIPGNEGRNYVLRRILRRAIRHGNQLGATDSFFYRIVDTLVEVMGEAYPILKSRQDHIKKIIKLEEEQFAYTLKQGLHVLENALSKISGSTIPGNIVFTLYDSHGFPVDLTNDIAREKGLTLDLEGFDQCMNEQRQRSQGQSNFTAQNTSTLKIDSNVDFVGYSRAIQTAQIVNIIVNDEKVDTVNPGQESALILDSTPFYAESGGQVGDTGIISSPQGVFHVSHTTKSGHQHLHWGHVDHGVVSINDAVTAHIDENHRHAIALNHTATHLLHAALREILGEHVTQKGSLVEAERLRFDFSHFEALSAQQLTSIENLVNQKIMDNTPIATHETSLDEAKSMGALALFGEKYSDQVRVLTMSNGFSTELCGGTHAEYTGDLSLLLIDSESGVSSGIRRIEAITGYKAHEAINQQRKQIKSLAAQLKTQVSLLPDKINTLLKQIKKQEQEIASLNTKQAGNLALSLTESSIIHNGINIIVSEQQQPNAQTLLSVIDEIKNLSSHTIIVFANISKRGEKGQLIVGCTKDICKQYKAGDLIKHITQNIGGKGGGRPDLAQGASDNLEQFKDIKILVEDWVLEKSAI